MDTGARGTIALLYSPSATALHNRTWPGSMIRTPALSDDGRISRTAATIEAKLGDDYEPNDQGVKVADMPVINAYRSPSDRTPPNKANYHKSYGYLRTPELSNVVRAFS